MTSLLQTSNTSLFLSSSSAPWICPRSWNPNPLLLALCPSSSAFLSAAREADIHSICMYYIHYQVRNIILSSLVTRTLSQGAALESPERTFSITERYPLSLTLARDSLFFLQESKLRKEWWTHHFWVTCNKCQLKLWFQMEKFVPGV